MLLIDRLRSWRGELALRLLWLLKALSTLPGMRGLYTLPGSALIRRSRLFDASYYLDCNPDVAEAEVQPLQHYVAHGDDEGRAPLPLFDPIHYRSQADSPTLSVNALIHYLLVGRYHRLSPSPWFDTDYYLRENRDVALSGLDPLYHYVHFGGAEGRSPAPELHGSFLSSTCSDVRNIGLNPLIRYVVARKGADNQPTPSGANEPALLQQPTQLQSICNQLAECEKRNGGHGCRISVVVPVYKGLHETLNCLRSILRARNNVPFELIVIDDASPDEILSGHLSQMAQSGLFTLLRNEQNQGFVHSVNRAMEINAELDVVVLNSDTEVYDGWLDRLHESAYVQSHIATVTPLSNNATICSYPRFLQDNPYPLELPYAELDRIAGEVNQGVLVAAPTGVGFCMYIRRDCLNKLGPFDEAAYGHGYGEENDFCQRASTQGYQNLIAANVFVRHLGGISFEGRKASLIRKNLRVVRQRFPNYDAEVRAFIRDDPVREYRRRLDWRRLEEVARERNVLIVGHDRGGGSERHVIEEINRLQRDGFGVFRLVPKRGDPGQAVLRHPTVRSVPNIEPFRLRDLNRLISLIKRLRVSEIHTHGLVDYVPEAPTYIIELARLAGIPVRGVLHDYKVVCPRINLVDRRGYYCGEPEVEGCNTCLRRYGSSFKVTDIRLWRVRHRQALANLESVIVPNADMAARLSRYFPDLTFDIRPHDGDDRCLEHLEVDRLDSTAPLRITVVGAISRIKGFDVLLACARDSKRRKLPLAFSLLGYSVNDHLLRKAGVLVTGRYHERQALPRLRELDPHLILLPSLWPETYSYTLSIALRSNKPICAFDIGAIAWRLRAADRSDFLLPLDVAHNPRALNSKFVTIRESRLKDYQPPPVKRWDNISEQL